MYVSTHRRQRAASVRRIGSEMLLLVGHPGLEPGANGLRTQQLTRRKALLLADSHDRVGAERVTAGHSGHQTGHRDHMTRAEMLAKICRARSRRIIGDERARLDIQRSFLISSYSSLVISPFAYRFFRMSRADSDSCLSPWP